MENQVKQPFNYKQFFGRVKVQIRFFNHPMVESAQKLYPFNDFKQVFELEFESVDVCNHKRMSESCKFFLNHRFPIEAKDLSYYWEHSFWDNMVHYQVVNEDELERLFGIENFRGDLQWPGPDWFMSNDIGWKKIEEIKDKDYF